MHILIGTDADYVVNEVTAALGGPDVSFTICRNGREISDVVEARTPDLMVLDLQIGSMGAMAVTMSLRLDESSGRLPHVKVLMLLDRRADVHLAKRCGAEMWLIKPVDALTLKRAARAVIDGPSPVPLATTAPARRWKSLGSTAPAAVESPEEEPAAAG
ncbi:MAG: putative two-component response regulator [Ilumatobacteraceae bacterium]|nr:putative two-component response regulator [Ilumatobacteraceae bacterium]